MFFATISKNVNFADFSQHHATWYAPLWFMCESYQNFI